LELGAGSTYTVTVEVLGNLNGICLAMPFDLKADLLVQHDRLHLMPGVLSG